jgi:hypothetical protein
MDGQAPCMYPPGYYPSDKSSVEPEEEKTEQKKMAGTSSIESSIADDGSLTVKVVFKADCYSCCVCFEKITGTITCCENFHAMCSSCVAGTEDVGDYRCPYCRSEVRGRNHLLEYALKDKSTVCPNIVNGCKHRSFPDDMDSHRSACRYADIDCPWCEHKTTPFDLSSHVEFDCMDRFYGTSCGDNINFIKSDAIKNIYMVSAEEETRNLYISKGYGVCNFLCIQSSDVGGHDSSIVITYSTGVEIQKKITLPIYTPSDLIAGKIKMHTITLDELGVMDNIKVSGFRKKYAMGDRFMAKDRYNNWYRCFVDGIRRNPDMILVSYEFYPEPECSDWIILLDGCSDRIRSLDANEGRTTLEEHIYLENLDEEEQLRIILENSLNDL